MISELFDDTPPKHKWVPLIDHDACTGCGKCVDACEPKCLQLVWDFATLVSPNGCDSCGACETACEHEVIHMGWMPVLGGPETGRWREGVQLPRAKRRSRWAFFRGRVRLTLL